MVTLAPEAPFRAADYQVIDERAERIAPHLADTSVRSTVLIRGADAINGVAFVDAIAGPAALAR